MIHGKQVLAVIPARGGSKGVPGKNIKPLSGKPLIAWAIECAARSQYIDRCIISTESEEIAEISRNWGGDVPFLRPAELALDDTPGIAPVLHAIDELPDYDIVVLLQPTSPLRQTEDIDGCIEKLVSSGVSSCVTVTLADKTPLWMYHLDEKGSMRPVLESNDRSLPRQQLPPVYVLNGAVYAAEVPWVRQTGKLLDNGTVSFIMPRARSLDIDTEEDFWIVEFQMNPHKKNDGASRE
ncbi:cytidylyltransferase domain-containing protein [Cohnella soli]|uniref:Cytidylyltransferase domain-containing protein n=1 Tax=Cohnella soli TaxID=425005 RepID=A0ABW0HMH1_9BACL